jgi:glycosyltransferase involved in cell wall biosynthesis
MRITPVTHYFPAHRGGIELVAAEIATHLAATHRARIAWHASDCDPPPSIPGVEAVPARSCNAVERRIGVPYPIWSAGALWRVGQAARAADVVHLHDCLYLPNLLTYAAARLAGRPVIVTQHIGMIPYRSPLLRALLTMAYRILGRIVLGGASQVVFVSDSVRRYFSGFVRFKAPPLLVANGVDTSVFHPLDEETRAALRLQLGVEGDTVAALVGRFVEKKGIPALPTRGTAARGAMDVWLGPLWTREIAAERRGVSRSLGRRPRSRTRRRPPVLPSVGEAFPSQEAMACGTPALVESRRRPMPRGRSAACGGHQRLGRVPLGAAHQGVDDRCKPRRSSPQGRRTRANWSWERRAER